MFGLTIGDKHTYNDFGLMMTSFYIPLPVTKTNQIEIPYSSGSIDLTEITGNPTFKDREGLRFEFAIHDKDWDSVERLKTRMAMYLHGRKLKMIPDNDLSYYYMARFEVNAEKEHKSYSKIILTGTAEPYKYDIIASDEPWLWDPFSFVDGVIRSSSNITVHSGDTFTILGAGVDTPPTFIVSQSNNLAVSAGGAYYSMPSTGIYKFPQIQVGAEDVTLTFSGSGKLSISYRGRYL